jgi:hypothetical protein
MGFLKSRYYLKIDDDIMNKERFPDMELNNRDSNT